MLSSFLSKMEIEPREFGIDLWLRAVPREVVYCETFSSTSSFFGQFDTSTWDVVELP
jgi:hypothetical protein